MKGKLKVVADITDIKEGVVIASFDGKTLLNIIETEEIEKSEFEIFHHQNNIAETSYAQYESTFKGFHKSLTEDHFSKIVLSKIKAVPTDKSAMHIFSDLCGNYLDTFNYLFSSTEQGCWIGATPELLCDFQDNQLKTVALAGTKLPHETWTSKEIDEQQYVTDYIVNILAKNEVASFETTEAKTVNAGTIQHLKSEIKATLGTTNSWQSITEALHPTPAVCGIPTKETKDFILKNESHDREFYTGYIGIINENVQCFVNLRCMQLQKDMAFLYLGGGLLKASAQEKEWEETERKAKTLIKVLIGS